MKIPQLSVFAENKPGKIFEPIRVLADNKIDLRALSLADTQNFGILRLIVSDVDAAFACLQKEEFLVKRTEVLAVEVPDRPGGLSHVLTALGEAAINIDYMYAFPSSTKSGQAALIFRFEDPEAAVKVLEAKGIRLLAQENL